MNCSVKFLPSKGEEFKIWLPESKIEIGNLKYQAV
jgi:hypothetical protein